MTTFVIMALPANARTSEGSEELKFIPDRFSILAFVFSLVWILYHRMWLVLLGYLATLLAVEVAAISVSEDAALIGMLAVSVVFGFEAQALRRWSLERKGWQTVGIAEGFDVEEAELRYAASRISPSAKSTAPINSNGPKARPQTSIPIVPRVGDEQVVGLMLGPETRK